MNGGDSGHTANFGDDLWGVPVGHIYSSVKERKVKNEVKSGGPRHIENQALVRYSTLYSGQPNDLLSAY